MAYEWKWVPSESEEMNLKWFDINNILYDEMFPYDKYWLPFSLDGKKIKAYFNFDENWNILSKDIKN